MLYNKVNQLYEHIYPFPLKPPYPHPTFSKSSQSSMLSSMCYTAASTSDRLYTCKQYHTS